MRIFALALFVFYLTTLPSCASDRVKDFDVYITEMPGDEGPVRSVTVISRIEGLTINDVIINGGSSGCQFENPDDYFPTVLHYGEAKEFYPLASCEILSVEVALATKRITHSFSVN